MPIPVCHLRFSDVVGGVETHLLALLPALDPKRYAPHVLTFENPAFEARLDTAGIPHQRLARGSKWDLGFPLRLRRALRASGARIVHTHGVYGDLYAALASRLGPKRQRHILTKHTFADADHTASARHIRRLDWLDRHVIYPRVDAFVAISDDRRRGLMARHQVDEQRIHVIANGVPIPDDPDALRGRLRRELGVGPEVPLIGFVGRFNREKGPDLFIEILARIADKSEEALGVLVGEGPMRPALEQRAAALDLASRLRWLGHRDDMPTVLSDLDVLVMPSRTEGMPMLLLEALALARPVVVSNVGGMPEVVVHGRTGWLCTPEHVEEFDQAVSHVLDRPDIARLVAAAGRERVATTHGAAVMASRMMTLYDQVLGGAR